MKPKKTGFSRIIQATRCSIAGFRLAWSGEAAFRQEIYVVIPLICLSIWFPVSAVEHLLLVGSLILVLVVELLNSAIEAAIDRVGPEWHELSGRAKDLGSASVLLCIILAVLIWIVIIVDVAL
ncbi:diacylglycerol kinase [Celerinatantimonas yamalensis]|uniref:Diacylglycerol kinase n=1 Tax=Celerinatantimonas yamalensis TaxID=559956 RepID=A0ABW9G6D2_9GAMM